MGSAGPPGFHLLVALPSPSFPALDCWVGEEKAGNRANRAQNGVWLLELRGVNYFVSVSLPLTGVCGV